MKVLVAETCGFCRGVKNAITLAQETLATHKKVYCLGHIIHNDDVVRKLTQAGLKCVETIDEIEDGTVLIRSHGATRAEIEHIKSKGAEIIDATCGLVKRVQQIAQNLNAQGYRVLMIGDKDHPEVRAIVGWADDICVAAGADDLRKISLDKKLGVICQTTQSAGYFAEMIKEIASRDFSELKIINTLCKETKKRQNSAVELCKKVDIMFVLGGLQSANTRKLAELCKMHNECTYHLQNLSELDSELVKGRKIAGVTAGASTPDWVIDEFVEGLAKF